MDIIKRVLYHSFFRDYRISCLVFQASSTGLNTEVIEHSKLNRSPPFVLVGTGQDIHLSRSEVLGSRQPKFSSLTGHSNTAWILSVVYYIWIYQFVLTAVRTGVEQFHKRPTSAGKPKQRARYDVPAGQWSFSVKGEVPVFWIEPVGPRTNNAE